MRIPRGDFFSTLTRDGDGDLALGGSHGGNGTTHGDILIGGEPVFLTDREGELLTPPAVAYRGRSGAYVVALKKLDKPIKVKGNF